MSHIMQAVTGGSSGHGRYAATMVKMWMCVRRKLHRSAGPLGCVMHEHRRNTTKKEFSDSNALVPGP